MNKIFNKNNLINIFLVLYVLSMFLDLHIFYNRVATLIRIVVISLLFIIILFNYGNKKDIKRLLILFGIYLLYIIIHIINIRDNSILNEIFYFYKLFANTMILYIVCKLELSLDKFNNAIKFSILFICGSIVICNLLKIGYSSYDFNRLEYSIFDWSNKDISFLLISSKGYFHLANQITAIIILYMPLLINDLKKNFNIMNIILLILLLVSSIMLGGRISVIVPLVVLVISFVIYLYLLLFKKEKFNIKFVSLMIIFMGLYSLLLSISPIFRKERYYDELIDKYNVSESSEIVKEENKSQVINKGTDDNEINFDDYIININFPTKYYPYENDKEFWDEFLKEDNDKLVDSRYVEKSIIKRVVKLNDNKLDIYFGIGYDRIINIQNIEQDYIMQYYSLGIIGCILIIGLYIVLYLYLLLKVFINMEGNFNYQNIMLLMGIGLVLVAAYFSGNLFNSISVIIPLGTLFGISINELNKKNNKNKYEYILGFKTITSNRKELNNYLEEDLKNKKNNILFNINPLILCNFYKDNKIVEFFNNEKYNFPDGIGIVYASKMKNGNIKERIAGIDLFDDICNIANKNNYSIYLYGSKPGVALKAKEVLEKKYKKLNVCGTLDGYGKEEDALKDILKHKPDILFIALGSPKQEKFIFNNKDKLKNIKLIMPIGGSLDVTSGNLTRAPKLVCKLHLEWLYRMVKEPKRFKQIKDLIRFVFLVIFRNNCYNKKWNGVTNDKDN